MQPPEVVNLLYMFPPLSPFRSGPLVALQYEYVEFIRVEDISVEKGPNYNFLFPFYKDP